MMQFDSPNPCPMNLNALYVTLFQFHGKILKCFQIPHHYSSNYTDVYLICVHLTVLTDLQFT